VSAASRRVEFLGNSFGVTLPGTPSSNLAHHPDSWRILINKKKGLSHLITSISI
jgi:hypothetical protein